MKAKAILLISVISITAMVGTMAHAKMRKGDVNSYRMLLSERGVKKLDLTVAQQTEIKSIAESEKAAMLSFKEEIKKDKAEMKALIQAETFDEIAFRQALTEGQSERTEIAVLKAKNKHKVWNILTVEQREKLENLKQKMRNKMKKRSKRENS